MGFCWSRFCNSGQENDDKSDLISSSSSELKSIRNRPLPPTPPKYRGKGLKPTRPPPPVPNQPPPTLKRPIPVPQENDNYLVPKIGDLKISKTIQSEPNELKIPDFKAPETPQSYECSLCLETEKSIRSLEDHLIIEHPQSGFKEFILENKYNKDKIHCPEEYCECVFDKKIDFLKHLMEFHADYEAV